MRLFILLFSLLCVSNFAFASEGSEAGGESKGDETGVEYLEITPKFVVNLVEPKKYLSINVQLLIEGKDTAVKIKKHMPALKHELIMLFSDRSMDSLQTMEQREALRQETVDVIHKTIDKAEGVEETEESAAAVASVDPHKKVKKKDYAHLPSAGFKDAFFTEFLLQ